MEGREDRDAGAGKSEGTVDLLYGRDDRQLLAGPAARSRVPVFTAAVSGVKRENEG